MADFKLDKENIANIYLFYGEENYKKRLYRDSLRKLVTAGNNMNYSYFEGKNIDFDSVYDSVVTLPFFAPKRLVVVENSGKFKQAKGEEAGGDDLNSSDIIEKILNEVPQSTCLAFFEESAAKNKKIYKYIAKHGVVVECAADDENALIKWLAKGFNQAGKRVSAKTLSLLVDRVGTDYDRLRMEYEKILGYVGDGSEVHEEDVIAVTMADVESKIFDMFTAMSKKDIKKALDKYYDLVANNEAPLYILAMLRIQFRMFLQIAELRNKGYTTSDVARMLRRQEFVIRNGENYLRSGLKMKDVRDILEEISKVDLMMKNSSVDDEIILEALLIKIATKF